MGLKETESPNWGVGIPIDLLMDIFLRLPTKSIVKCRCVSKFWGSILVNPDFTELFLSRSSLRPPLILFTFQVDGNLLFFSSPQPRNPEDNTCLVPAPYRVIPALDFASEIRSHLYGFICCRGRAWVDTVVICNPVTGESLSLPKVDPDSRPYLAFDSVKKQFKVLCVNFDTTNAYQVLTLADSRHTWRIVPCKPHYPKSGGICIDGVLYYTAWVDRQIRVSMIVCFDVCSEIFSFINIDELPLLMSHCTLINYKGKLGALQTTRLSPRYLELWVLEDAVKHKWSKHTYILPSLWNNIAARSDLAILGITAEGEVVLSPYCLADPFYIYYYNLETASFRGVRIQGLESFKRKRVYISLNYAENFKLI